MVETETLLVSEDLKRDLMTEINLDLGVQLVSQMCVLRLCEVV